MTTQPHSNRHDRQQMENYLKEIRAADAQLLELKTDHMNACKGPRARIKNVMKEARAAGLNMNAFRTLVNNDRDELKIDERIAELESDDREDYESMERALGKFADTPLGEAALHAKKKEEALNNLAAG